MSSATVEMDKQDSEILSTTKDEASKHLPSAKLKIKPWRKEKEKDSENKSYFTRVLKCLRVFLQQSAYSVTAGP
jgi:hypothetical protein